MEKPLTKYPEGSIRELWSISLPLMISSLASLLMIFVDRCFLARYSLQALNAAVNAGTLAWAFLGGFAMLTAMSEVFVAQYNGARQYKNIGIPVWQMIWFSIASIAFFMPLGLFGGKFIFPKSFISSLQIDYFKYLMIFGAFYPLMNAFAGFYVGRGKTRFLIYLAVLANFVNILFDWMFIFGVKDWIPEMGIKGAAIATCLGTIFQTVVLGCLFLKKKNRQNFGTNKYKFHYSIFKKCFKVGFPPAIYYALEIFGWALFYMMMTTIGELHITVSSICQSIILLLWFFFDGIARGISALAGNFIGAKRIHLVHSLVKASLKLLVIFMAVVSILMIIDPKIIVDFLIPGNIESQIFKWKASSGVEFYSILRISLLFVFAYLLFEGVRWIFAGLLTAAGDTWFLLIAGSISVWLFLLLPVYFIVVKFSLAVQYAWMLAALYSILLSVFYYLRFVQGKWKKISLIEKEIADE